MGNHEYRSPPVSASLACRAVKIATRIADQARVRNRSICPPGKAVKHIFRPSEVDLENCPATVRVRVACGAAAAPAGYAVKNATGAKGQASRIGSIRTSAEGI